MATPLIQSKLQPQKPLIPSPFQGISQDFQNRGNQVTQAVQSGAQALQSNANPFSKGLSLAQTGLNTAGAVAGGAGDILKNAVSPLIQGAGSAIASIPGFDKVANSGPVNAIAAGGSDLLNRYNQLRQQHPQAFQDIGSVLNIVGTLLADKAGQGGQSQSNPNMGKTFEPGGNTSNNVDMYDKLISSGDMQPSQVYSDPTNRVYTPEVATKIIGDTVNQFQNNPALSNQLNAALQPLVNSLTPDKLLQVSQSIVQNGAAPLPMGRYGTGTPNLQSNPTVASVATPEASNMLNQPYGRSDLPYTAPTLPSQTPTEIDTQKKAQQQTNQNKIRLLPKENQDYLHGPRFFETKKAFADALSSSNLKGTQQATVLDSVNNWLTTAAPQSITALNSILNLSGKYLTDFFTTLTGDVQQKTTDLLNRLSDPTQAQNVTGGINGVMDVSQNKNLISSGSTSPDTGKYSQSALQNAYTNTIDPNSSVGQEIQAMKDSGDINYIVSNPDGTLRIMSPSEQSTWNATNALQIQDNKNALDANTPPGVKVRYDSNGNRILDSIDISGIQSKADNSIDHFELSQSQTASRTSDLSSTNGNLSAIWSPSNNTDVLVNPSDKVMNDPNYIKRLVTVRYVRPLLTQDQNGNPIKQTVPVSGDAYSFVEAYYDPQPIQRNIRKFKIKEF